MKIHLRRRKLSSGKIGLYAERYNSGKRSFASLGLQLSGDKDQDRQTLAKAKKAIAEKQADLQRGFEAQQIIMLHEYINQLNHSKRGNYTALLKHTDDVVMHKIDSDYLSTFKDYLSRLKIEKRVGTTSLKLSTQFAIYAKLKTVLKHSHNDGIIRKLPFFPVIKYVPTEHKIYLTSNEVVKLIDTPCHFTNIKEPYLFLTFSGLRAGDLKSLTWEDIKTDEDGLKYIDIIIKKNKKHHRQYLSDQALEYLPEPAFKRVFQWFNNSDEDNQLLRAWIKSAGIDKHVTWHSARHTFAMLNLSKGATLEEIKDLLGHLSIKSTEIYAKLNDERRKKAGRRELI